MTAPAPPGTAWPLAVEQRLSVNGVDLSAYAVISESLAGLMVVPKRRGNNISVPGRHGTLHVPGKLYDEATIVLPLMVAGAEPDGSIPIGSSRKEELYHRADELCRLFAQDQVTLTHTLPDQTSRSLTCEVLGDPISFTRNLGEHPLIARVKVPLRASYPFWVDATVRTAAMTLATGAARLLTEFAASTAPIDQSVVTFIGPISNPTLAVPATGVYLAYDGVLTAGQKLVIDTGAWSMSSGDGTAWTVNYGALRHGGVPGRWFEIAPAVPAPSVNLVHTTGAPAACQISAANRYLIG